MGAIVFCCKHSKGKHKGEYFVKVICKIMHSFFAEACALNLFLKPVAVYLVLFTRARAQNSLLQSVNPRSQNLKHIYVQY
jgi:hypothetical protein